MKRTKRLFDLVCSSAGLLLLSPLLIFAAMLIKLGDRGPVFFRQERIGYRGRSFDIWKFRTMVPDSCEKGGTLTLGNDGRITRVGRYLRMWKLDELPQLINVFKGEMSLVGPRPEVPLYVDCYNEWQKKVLELVPGITDPASIKYRHESEILSLAEDPERTYRQEIMPDKIAINLKYAEKSNLAKDLRLIIVTIGKVFFCGPARGGNGYQRKADSLEQ